MDSSRDTTGRPSLMGRMRGSSAASARFPLPTDFFARVECSPEQGKHYEQQAEQLRDAAVCAAKWSMSYEDGSSGWKLSSSKKHFRDTGIRTYCKRHDASRVAEFKCMGKVAMPLAHTMDALYADSTLDFRSNSTFLMENCLDAAVLHVVARRDEIEPHNYVGINWFAARSPGLFGKSRDICFLRSTGTVLDSAKSEIGYLVMHSVELPECAPLEGLVRTTVSGVMLFKQSADGRATDVMWQGSSPSAGATATGKLVALMHDTFTSYVTNLNKVTEAKFMAHQMESKRAQLVKGVRKYCYMCNKRFTLIRPRYSCGICSEDVCKDCGSASRVKSFDSDKCVGGPGTATRTNRADSHGTHFCKRCVHSARKELQNQPAASPAFFSTTQNLFLDVAASEATEEDSYERLSALSSAGSTRSLQKILSERSMQSLATEHHASKIAAAGVGANGASMSASAPQSLSADFTADFSSSHVPLSPLSIRTHREKGRQRLETDPMESYDVYEYDTDDADVLDAAGADVLDADAMAAGRFSSNSSSNNAPFGDSRRSSYENRDRDLAARLREISAKAQEALDVTRRHSCMMSDTSSAPRTSELLAFQQLDQSIAEQADLLNVIGFVSTGRVYMENNGPESGGVRISESSDLSDSERFEVLT